MFDLREYKYINPYYMLKSLINTWFGVFNNYENLWDWQMYHVVIIRSDLTTSNKSGRRKIRISTIMDEMNCQISRLSSLER
jgi:hypothetical protein